MRTERKKEESDEEVCDYGGNDLGSGDPFGGHCGS